MSKTWEELAVTADGVRVKPGDRVWDVTWPESNPSSDLRGHRDVVPLLVAEPEGPRSWPRARGPGFGESNDVPSCYSTRLAALRAARDRAIAEMVRLTAEVDREDVTAAVEKVLP